MAIGSSAVTISTTATLIGTTTSRRSLAISVPSGGATVYVGDSGVTTANGFPVEAGTKFAINEAIIGDMLAQYPVYGRVAAATQEIRILEGRS